MSNGCPNVPLQLPDGTVIQPKDRITLEQLCAILPALLEMEANAQTGLVRLPVVGRPAPPGFGTAGPTAGPAGGGNAGAPSWSGGGGRGARGPAGPRGPQGPAGAPGTGTPEGVVVEDGDFTIAAVSPFVPIPGARLEFNQANPGTAVFLLSAVFGAADGESTNGQMGIRVDGVDYPLAAHSIRLAGPGNAQFNAAVHGSRPVALAAGAHVVEAVVRGDSVLSVPVGNPVTVAANPTIPLALSVLHR